MERFLDLVLEDAINRGLAHSREAGEGAPRRNGRHIGLVLVDHHGRALPGATEGHAPPLKLAHHAQEYGGPNALPAASVAGDVGHKVDELHRDPLLAVELADVDETGLPRRALGRVEQRARQRGELRRGQRPVDRDAERNAAALDAGPVVDGRLHEHRVGDRAAEAVVEALAAGLQQADLPDNDGPSRRLAQRDHISQHEAAVGEEREASDDVRGVVLHRQAEEDAAPAKGGPHG
eukprot:scaffold58602_cov62-Phaeocystis_antarctica.AAC.7